MPSAASLTPESRFIALFVGSKHSGKTVAAASFPKPAEFLDFDQRIRGILGAEWIERDKIYYETFPPKEQGMIARFNKHLETMIALASARQLPQQTEVLDSLTSMNHAMISQAMSFTHKPSGSKDGPKSGKYIGPLAMSGPEDYGFEAQATYDTLSYLRSVPIPNVIVTAHIIDRYGKLDPDNAFSESVIIGQKLSLRDKIAANIGIYFDHIFKFDRRMENGIEKFYVRFRDSIACTSYSQLDEREHDITGKNFYEYMMGLIRKT